MAERLDVRCVLTGHDTAKPEGAKPDSKYDCEWNDMPQGAYNMMEKVLLGALAELNKIGEEMEAAKAGRSGAGK